jgi:electron transfer flavoprotein alpha subunit
MEIIVWSDDPALLGGLIGQARSAAETAGWGVALLELVSSELVPSHETPATAAVDVVYRIVSESVPHVPDAYVDLLAGAMNAVRPGLVLVGATKLGLEVAPRLAERTGAGYAAWAVAVELDPASGAVIARCTVYAGAGQASYRFAPGQTILTATQGVAGEGLAAAPPRIVSLDVGFGMSRVSVLGDHPKVRGARLEDARVVVDVGQGVAQREDLDMIRIIAGLLDGQVACSRPVASDRDWFPEWLGLSGAKVSPELCLTVGVSGAIQHVVGIRDSRIIAAVNSDENAAIFGQADFGVVADLYEFLPALIERLKARGIRPTWDD